jgi:glucan biosynthesis protein C
MTGRLEEGRRGDIDWLRAGAVYLLLAFHTAKVFDHRGWHVKDAAESDVVDAFTGLVRLGHMPLLFTLAGWSVAPSLERRAPRAFLRERRERLLVPFLFGCATLIPLATYVEVRHAGRFDGGIVDFMPVFVTDEFTWMHLWFLIYLLAFTALYLPAFRWIRRRDWRIDAVPSWGVYAAIVPFAAVQVALRGRWPGYQNLYDDWANFAYYSLFFVAGFLLTQFPAIEDAVQRERRRALVVAVAAVAAMAGLARGLYPPSEGSAEWVAFQALSAVAGVSMVVALLGFGHAHLRSRERGLAYARDSAMPVYVLHQPLIVFLAVPVVALPIGVPLKLGLLLGASTAATVGAYHLVVRRSRVLQRLLGAKPARLRERLVDNGARAGQIAGGGRLA